jgi:hypothetical protein
VLTDLLSDSSGCYPQPHGVLSGRKEETILLARWAVCLPTDPWGGVDLAVKMFAAMPNVELVNPPRMADFELRGTPDDKKVAESKVDMDRRERFQRS